MTWGCSKVEAVVQKICKKGLKYEYLMKDLEVCIPCLFLYRRL